MAYTVSITGSQSGVYEVSTVDVSAGYDIGVDEASEGYEVGMTGENAEYVCSMTDGGAEREYAPAVTAHTNGGEYSMGLYFMTGDDPMFPEPGKLAEICATGLAKRHYHIGDEIRIQYRYELNGLSYSYRYPFIVAHFGDAEDENGVVYRDSMYMMAKYVPDPEMHTQFDAAESIEVDLTEEPNQVAGWYYSVVVRDSGRIFLSELPGAPLPTGYDAVYKSRWSYMNSDWQGISQYGYGRWSQSCIRQWLNSTAAYGEGWWEATHEGDVAPATGGLGFGSSVGFMNGFSQEWRNIFRKVKVNTAVFTLEGRTVDTTYDKFFLPSEEQMYGYNPETAGIEGEYWEYCKERLGTENPSSAEVSNSRKFKTLHEAYGNIPIAQYGPVYLRTQGGVGSSLTTRLADGAIKRFTNADDMCAALPCFVIFGRPVQ